MLHWEFKLTFAHSNEVFEILFIFPQLSKWSDMNQTMNQTGAYFQAMDEPSISVLSDRLDF